MKKSVLYLLLTITVHCSLFTIHCKAVTGPLLYGMTQGGGANSKGNIFKVNNNGSNFATLYSFNTAAGYAPVGSLSQSFSNSRLYGMAQLGGANNAGVLFSFDPATNTYIDLIDFNTANGSTPTGNLIQASNGLMYGMTQSGGASGDGVLFSLDLTTNAFTVLVNFTGTNGSFPNASLIQARNGLLYGMTKQGGSNNFGTIFTFNTSTNTLTIIVNFTGNNGSSPGSNPYGTLVQMGDSTIFGLTRLGGSLNAGVLFGINPINNSFSLLYQFNTFSNHYPNGSLCLGPNGMLYGLTSGGGTLSGTIFQFDPTINILATVITFGNSEHPKGSFIFAGNGLMYCMMDSGGTSNNGKILMFDPGNFTIVTILNFDGVNGSHPWGDLTITRCPMVNFHADTSTFCKPLNTQFTNQSTYSISYFWAFGDGITDTSMNPLHTYGFPGFDTVMLIATNLEGCKDTMQKIYHFVTNPTQAAFTADTVAGCPTLTVHFTNNSQYGTSFMWYFGDGTHSTAISPGHNYNASAYYDVRLYAYDSINSCDDTLIIHNYIHVLQTAPVTSSFTMDALTGCTPLNINFTNNSSNNATSFTWYFGDGDTSNLTNPSHIYTSGDSLFPKLIAYNVDTTYPCVGKSIFYDTLVVHLSAHAIFVADSLHGCLPLTDHFTNSTTHGISYLWHFGDGDTSTAINPVHIYTNAGTFSDTLIAYGDGGCNDTLIRSNYIATQVRPNIIPSFAGSPLTGCDSLLVHFSNNSSDATFYLWHFGDGGTASITNPNHNYSNPGTYSVTLFAYNYALCGLLSDTLILHNYVHVLTPPNIIITQSGDTLTSNFATGNQWYNNGIIINGATSQRYLVPSTGCYQTTYTDTNGCSNISNVICINFVGINELTNTSGIAIYPNPFSDKATLVINENINTKNASLIICNLLGQEVKRIRVGHESDQSGRLTITRDQLPNGMYFYKLTGENKEVFGVGKIITN